MLTPQTVPMGARWSHTHLGHPRPGASRNVPVRCELACLCVRLWVGADSLFYSYTKQAYYVLILIYIYMFSHVGSMLVCVPHAVGFQSCRRCSHALSFQPARWLFSHAQCQRLFSHAQRQTMSEAVTENSSRALYCRSPHSHAVEV